MKNRNEDEYICIYCCFKKNWKDFNREHVLPQSFGKYGPETLTLVNKVCGQCNQIFGNTTDNSLARNTQEGLWRIKNGFKTIDECDLKKYTQNQRILADLGFELVRSYDNNTKKLNLKPKKDVAFPKTDGQYDDFYIKEIPDKQTLLETYPDLLKKTLILNFNIMQEIRFLLSEMFNDFKINTIENLEGICFTTIECKKEVLRGIAKIAFNFFAYFDDDQVVLNDCFDPIRKFIREGVGDNKSFIEHDTNPIIPDKIIDGKFFAYDLHLIAYYMDENSLWCSISLHNQIHWKICLAKEYRGKPVAQKSKFFCPHTKTSGDLQRSSLIIAPYLPTLLLVKNTLLYPRGNLLYQDI